MLMHAYFKWVEGINFWPQLKRWKSEPSRRWLWVIRGCSKDHYASNVFVERAHPSRETCLSRTLTPNPGESMVASSARLTPVFLLTKFSLVCRLDVLVFFLSFVIFFGVLDYMIFLVFWVVWFFCGFLGYMIFWFFGLYDFFLVF